MFEYEAVEENDASLFARQVTILSKDNWEVEATGMVSRGQHGYTIWWALMRRPTALGD